MATSQEDSRLGREPLNRKSESANITITQPWLRVVTSARPYLIVFVASACGLILEIVAARILAPKIGVSLYTWTSIIGVVLAGISIGNYLGGRIADRFPSPTTLGFILLSAGITSLSVLPLLDVVSAAFESLPIVMRIIFLTSTLFLVPSTILGMVTPLVVKLNLRDISHAGNVVGKIYAVSTSGAIFGVFITGFVLIQWIGSRQTILAVALVLVSMALVFGSLWRLKMPSFLTIAVFIGLGSFSSLNGNLQSDCLRESNYFCIQVTDDIVEDRYQVKILHLDDLLHSYVSLDDPTLLIYKSQKIFAEFVTQIAVRKPEFRALFIGGGGYTMPRYIEEVYPHSRVEVIEIDPDVTRVAFDYLGLREDTRIDIYHEDARIGVLKLPSEQYDLIVGDAFNDVAVPYHLTTREFNDQIRSLLTDIGVYVVHVVDKFQTGKFARSYVHTLQQTFPHVYVVRSDTDWKDDSRKSHVVVASLQPLSQDTIKNAMLQDGRGEPVGRFMPKVDFDSWLGSRSNVLITDNFAPVDNMLAFVYLERPKLTKAQEHFTSGVYLRAQERLHEAIYEYDKAIKLDPEFATAYLNRANLFKLLGHYHRALQDYDKAIGLNPQSAAAYYNRSVTYAEIERDGEALEDLNAAIRFDPQFALAHVLRGRIHLRLEQHELALQDYSQAIRLDPNDGLTYAARALVHTVLGQDDQAQRDFERAVELGVDFTGLTEAINEGKKQR